MLLFPTAVFRDPDPTPPDFTCPPIPDRGLDWCAWDDRLGADGSPYGWGPTKAAAIAHELTGADMSLEDARAVFADMPHHDEATIDAAADTLLALGEPEEIDAAAEWMGTRV